MPAENDISYVNSSNYEDWTTKLKELVTVLEDLTNKSEASRRLRYAEVDIEAEREEGRLQPDELYIPQHIIDTNIRREQSPYVQYVTQSPRAVICEDSIDPAVDLALLERDLTKKIRFEGWQLSLFASIDGFQANGYSIMEVVQDKDAPGGISHEAVQFGDFAFIMDTRDIQSVEMTARAVYFTKSRLLKLVSKEEGDGGFDPKQTENVIESASDPDSSVGAESYDLKDKSLKKLYKNMMRINGVVHVAWSCPNICSGWVRAPKPLYLGDREAVPLPQPMGQLPNMPQQPDTRPVEDRSKPKYETEYPYCLFPYLISENDTISHLKGRVFLDQDCQEAVTSLTSSLCTQSRRAAGLYFSKDVSDPNDDLLLQKNVFFRQGALINSKVTSFKLDPPDPASFSAISALVSANQNETSQVNFAVNNRKDSRKTAEEIKTASQQATLLSTVQVTLFSLALKTLYTKMTRIIKSRVLAGLITVDPSAIPLYQRSFIVKPSGDTDVIEKQQLIAAMQQAWPVVQQTPIATVFLTDMLELLFPVRFAKYQQILQQAQQQQQSQQQQTLQQGMQLLQQLASGIIQLSKHKDYFSETGQLHAYPIIQHSAEQLEALQKQMQQSQGQKQQPQIQ